MMSWKLLLLLGFVYVCQIRYGHAKPSGNDPLYAAVGPCEPYLKYVITDFTICKVAGKGDYYYYYSTSLDKSVTCAKAQIDQDKKHGSGTVFDDKNPTGKQTVYDLVGSSNGIILEDYTPEGTTDVHHFKLLITDYDDTYGVMSYIRCSDSGTKKNFVSFSTVVKESTLTDAVLMKKANAVIKEQILKVKPKGALVKYNCVCAADDAFASLDYIYTQ